MIKVSPMIEVDRQKVRDFFSQKGMDFSGIRLRYDRGDDFKTLLNYQAPRSETILAKDGEDIRTMVSLTSGPRWLDGKVQEVGFLSDFRIDGTRASTKAWRDCLTPAIEIFKKQIAPLQIQALFAIILKDNQSAIRSLTNERRLTDYKFSEVSHVDMINLFARFSSFPIRSEFSIENISPIAEPELMEFLHQHESQRQVGYVMKSDSFSEFDWRKKYWGFRSEDFIVIRKQGKIIACTLPWAASPLVKKMYFSDAPWILETGLKLLKYLGKPAILRNEPIRTLYMTHLHIEDGFNKSDILQLFLNFIYSKKINAGFHMVSFADWWGLSKDPGLLRNTYHQRIPVGIYSVHNNEVPLHPITSPRLFNFEMAVI